MYTLHKLPEGFIVTSDEYPTKKGELYYNTINYQIHTLDGVVFNHCKKVISQQDQIDFSTLSEEEQKEIGWFDVNKLTTAVVLEIIGQHNIQSSTAKDMINIGVKMFQKAQELLSDRNFTLKDIHKSITFGYKKGMKVEADAHRDNTLFQNEDFDNNKFIQSLSQPKSWDINGKWNNDVFIITNII